MLFWELMLPSVHLVYSSDLYHILFIFNFLIHVDIIRHKFIYLFFFKFYFIFIFIFFLLFYFIFKLYIIVLVLPNIKMNPPQVYMCSPSWTLLSPPSPYHPSGSSQCSSPKHPVSCIEPFIYFSWDWLECQMCGLMAVICFRILLAIIIIIIILLLLLYSFLSGTSNTFVLNPSLCF